jgi:ferritin-like metal-binding protein YciE
MAKTERSGHTTTSHDFIRQWVEERGGWPARVVGTGGENDAGLIRIDFPGFSGEGSLEQIEWDEWFQGFEANQLAFLHRDMDHGGGDLDRFNKLVSRTGEEDGEEDERGGEGGGRGRAGQAAKSARAGASKSAGGAARKSASAGAAARKTDGGDSARDTEEDGGGSARKRAAAGGGGSARKTAATAAETGTRASGGGASRGRGADGADGADGAGSTGMRGLLLHDLGDLLSAERQFLVTTRALAREAQDPEVRERAEEHVTETEGQIQRLNEAFAALGERPRAVRCEAAVGLKEEHDAYKREEKPSKQLLSAFGLGSGLRVEHYEIAAYRGAVALAGALGEKECAQLLNESLREEMAMASFLEKTSKTLLRRMAAGEGAGDGASSDGSSGRGGSSAAKRASSSAKGGSSTAKRASSAKGGASAGRGARAGGSAGGGSRDGARA